MKAKLKPSNVNPAPIAQCLTFGTHSLCILLVPKSVGTPTSPVPPFIPHSLACRLRLAPLPTYGCPWKVSHSSGLSKHLGSPLQMRHLHQGSPCPHFRDLVLPPNGKPHLFPCSLQSSSFPAFKNQDQVGDSETLQSSAASLDVALALFYHSSVYWPCGNKFHVF